MARALFDPLDTNKNRKSLNTEMPSARTVKVAGSVKGE